MLQLLVAAGHITKDEANMTDVDLEQTIAPTDVVAAIKADEHLLPEAKRHLTSQYGLLLRITTGVESEVADTSTRAPLRAVARRGTPKKRGTDGKGAT